MGISGGSGSLLWEVLHWLWLPILLGAAVALLATPRWRRKAAEPIRAAALFTVVAVIAELLWRVVAAESVPPLAAWAAALCVLSVALSGLSLPARQSVAAAPLEQPWADVFSAAPGDDPFRSSSGEMPEDRAPWIRHAFEQSSDAMAIFDLEGRIERVNLAWARLHGYRRAEIEGHHVSLFQTPGHMEALRARMDETRRDGATLSPCEHRTKNGEAFSTRMRLTLLRDAASEPTGFVAVARPDQAVPAAAEPAASDAEQATETLRVLVGSAAHEFNNLLTGILGNATLLSQKPSPGGDDEVSEIEGAARRAADLARLLQAYAGKSQLAAESVMLNDLVTQASPALERIVGGRAVGRRLRLFYRLGDEPASIAVDPVQIRLLVSNLVANAADAYGPGQGGEITVRTGRIEVERRHLDRLILGDRRGEGPYGFVEVADGGEGLDETTRQQMFEPFFTTRDQHRGLGLAAVLGITRAHRGAIEVESRPGSGARIRVLFPCTSEPVEAAPPADAAGVGSPAPDAGQEDVPRQRSVILVVDDERIIRDLAQSVLDKEGFSVLLADEGRPAVRLYRRHRQDIRCVLLDLSMPIMSGEEVFAEIRDYDPEARIVLMTGHDAGDVRRSFEKHGLAGVLQKPFKPDQLIGTLRSVLGRPG